MLRRAGARFVTICAALAVLAVAGAGPASAAEGCTLVESGRDAAGAVIYKTVCPGDEAPAPEGPPRDGAAADACDKKSVEGAAAFVFCVGTTACAVNNPSTLAEDTWPLAERPTPAHIYTFRFCITADGTGSYGWSWYLPPDLGPSLEELAQQAYGAMVAPVFSLGFNPPGRGVVGIPTWFWAQGAGAEVIVGSSALGVTAIGAPTGVELDPGDGTGTRTCAWSVAAADTCSHTYARSSARQPAGSDGVRSYPARARLVYDVRFENNGAPLVLPGLPTALESEWQTALVPVAEIQALVTTS